MKRKILFIATVIVCLALLATGTMAYYSSKVTTHNVITSGGVEIALVDSIVGGEETRNEDGGLTGWTISDIMPGTQVKKNVAVRNTGMAEAWVRLKLTLTITDGSQEELPLEMEVGQEVVPLVSYTLDSDTWLEQGGYIYFRKPLPAGGITPSLFADDLVSIHRLMGNRYQNSTITISVQAQAVQTANNPIPDGKDVTAVKGWPVD